MKWCQVRLSILVCLACFVSTAAFAQGASGKSSLSGVVVDAGGGVIPGATIVVKNDATGFATTVVTNTSGVFSLPALDVATYTVTVSLQGFKTVTVKDVRIIAGLAASVPKIALEIGSLSEIIEVKGGSDLVQTQSGTVSATLQTETLKTIPLPTRNALYAVNMLPGVDTVGTVRDSSIAGLPEQTINITLDGVNVNNNQDKAGDGFYAMVRPNLDAIEQVTLSTAAQGADSAGQGAVQIRFVTRSGTNMYKGTAYDYFRHPNLNSNSWINYKNGLARNRIILHQAGASVGGPLKLPGLYDGSGKAFFFFNYEEFYQPTEATRTRTLLNPNAQAGLFNCSTCTGGGQLVPLLQIAGNAGHTNTFDPTVQALMAEVRAAAQLKGNITTPAGATNTQTYIFNSPGKGVERLPTTRVDFNLTNAHRLSGVYYWQQIDRLPDIQNNGDSNFPGLPNTGSYYSRRTAGSITMRSTLSSSLVNELIGGWQDSPGYFFDGITRDQFANQDFFAMSFPLGATSATNRAGGVEHPRNTPNWNIDNTVTWQRGQHSLSFGGSFSQFRYTQVVSTVVPTANFGIDTANDPANAIFNATNFPGASTNEVNQARDLYAFLTGRITSINATSALNDDGIYTYNGDTNHRIRHNQWGVFGQDSWRVSPTLTFNYGARWEVQTPVITMIKSYSTATMADVCGPSGVAASGGPGGRACNMFNPGVFNAPGQVPQFTQYQPNTGSYNTDWDNIAPNVSVAWRPNATDGLLRRILGDPETATIRAGYSIAYNRNGMAELTGVFGANTGRTTNSNRNNTVGNLVLAGESWPILYREKNRLGPPPTCPASGTGPAGCIPIQVSYPLPATTNNSVNIFDPNLQLSYTHSYSIGIQRSLSRDMVVEVRYVGNQNKNAWTTENWNELNIYENGFLNEFKLAQTNLQANLAWIAANGTLPDGSSTATFKYTGVAGTAPLPIYLAHFNALGAGSAGTPGSYTGNNWTNTGFVGRLDRNQPSPTGAAGDLFGSATFRTNMLNAGRPTNYWVLNPLISAANVRTGANFSKYHSIQTELRRRLSRGLLVSGNYTWSRQFNSASDGFHFDRFLVRSPNVPHSFKVNTAYEVPVGRGKRFGTNFNPWLNGFAGGWTFAMTGRVQVRTLSISGARLVGMSLEQLQNEYSFRIDGSNVVTMLPQDIILNTQRAFSTSATSATGYSALGPPTERYIAPSDTPTCIALRTGDCGAPDRIFLTAPLFTRFDMTLRKQFPLGGRRTFDLQLDINNVFNAINFTPVFNPSNAATQFQTNNIYQDISQSFDPGGRLGQIVVRFNW